MKYSILLPISAAVAIAQSSLVAAYRAQEGQLHFLPRYTPINPYGLYPRGINRSRKTAAQGTSSRGTSQTGGKPDTSSGGGGLRSSDDRAAQPSKASKQPPARLGIAHGGVSKKQAELRVEKPKELPMPISPFATESQSPKRTSSSNPSPFQAVSMRRSNSVSSAWTSLPSKTSGDGGGGVPLRRLRRQPPLPGASSMLAMDMGMLSTDDR